MMTNTLTFVVEDQEWPQKLGIAVLIFLLSMIPLLGLIASIVLLGYCRRLFCNVVAGHERPLPAWDKWEEDLVIGLQGFLIVLVYWLPAILLLMGLGLFGALGDLLLNGAMAGELDSQAFEEMGGIPCFSFAWMLFLFPAMIVIGVLTNAALVRFFATGSIYDGFNVGAVFGLISRNLGPFLVTALLTFLVVLAGELGVLLCFVGMLVTMPYSFLMVWKMWADFYRQANV